MDTIAPAVVTVRAADLNVGDRIPTPTGVVMVADYWAAGDRYAVRTVTRPGQRGTTTSYPTHSTPVRIHARA